MKKYTKVLALALALTMMLSMSVFAAGEKIETVTGKNGASIVEDAAALKGAEKFGLTYTYADSDPAKEEMFLILVLLGEEEANPLPDKDNILYVNQKNGNGSVTFSSVYPSEIEKSTIYLAGGSLSGLTPIGSITKQTPAFKVGDVNNDGEVNGTDRGILARYLAEWPGYELQILSWDAADINGDGEVNGQDRGILARYLAEWHGEYDEYFK
ncbi:MAG: hypothetical protein IJA56_04485 [Clostridia bacterium]|nr:hypothetical protein [Clostridia bacterium]